jgi:hypothetical protein
MSKQINKKQCEIYESAFHPRSTGVPQKGQSETMTDKMRNEARNKKTFKNNA